MANILVLDTLGVDTSVAWVVDGVIYHHAMTRYKHADVLGECLGRLTDSHTATLRDIDLLVVNIGPGSFTGLRVGIASSQAIAWAHSIPVWPVSHLLGCAYQAHWSTHLNGVDNGIALTQDLLQAPQWQAARYHVALDARMQEVYSGRFYSESDPWINAVESECLLSVDTLVKSEVSDIAIGDGWPEVSSPFAISWAAVMAMVAWYRYKQLDVVSADKLQAVYLRNRVV